ncbi:cytosol non-specific dipeptidase [Anaeramoeba flamelloides]|uniref:Cytosol non-specific dipeptidase n=1 Tax=Anaeramoeba flamelloides TaxID=1746091 RepID=A0AAV7ZMH7_9EUKA|nr:cytosol non-specific dipeptidase [Anaeramoeba flamelloides]
MEAKNSTNKKVLKSLLEPKKVFNLFLGICEIPRASGNTEAITESLINYGEKLGVQTKMDKIGNVLFNVPATKGFEKKPSVCIQTHMDMFAKKDEGINFDFEVDIIKTKIDKGWLTAQGTTLGADNGIGMALSLALLTEEFDHGPLELLFTVDGKTTLKGALQLPKKNFIKSKYLINLDSEEDGRICFGSAGGIERILNLPLIYAEELPKRHTQVDLYLHELLGGDTGTEIHENRANAIKWMTRLLTGACGNGFVIANLHAGISKYNIPSECRVSVLVPDGKVDQFMMSVQETHEQLLEEYYVIETKGIILEVLRQEQQKYKNVLTLDSTLAALDLLHAIPHGILRMSTEVEDLVESSQSLSMMKIVDQKLSIVIFARSSSYSQLRFLDQQLSSIATLSGSEYIKNEKEDFPPWEPKLRNNLLLDTMNKAFSQVYKRQSDCYAIHGVLECSIIQDKYKGLIPLSIGPNIINSNSTNEKLEIKSVNNTFKLLKRTLELIIKK